MTEEQQVALEDIKERLYKVEILIPDERYAVLVQSLRDDVRTLLEIIEAEKPNYLLSKDRPKDSQPLAYHLAWELRNMFDETPIELQEASSELLRLQHESIEFRKALAAISWAKKLELAVETAENALHLHPLTTTTAAQKATTE